LGEALEEDRRRMKWSTFVKNHLHDSGWFEKSRVQTRRALKKVVPKLPDSAIPDNLLIFAPASNLLGMVWKSSYSNDQYMYLDWQLETETFEEAVFTVAHEFAHLELLHPSRTTSGKKHMKQHEFEADTLAEHWGFKKPEKPKKKKKKK
jgi:Zn-dependent peptidase ImmA (M78 family)